MIPRYILDRLAYFPEKQQEYFFSQFRQCCRHPLKRGAFALLLLPIYLVWEGRPLAAMGSVLCAVIPPAYVACAVMACGFAILEANRYNKALAVALADQAQRLGHAW